MKLTLQESVIYTESLKWNIHNNYFQKKGVSAWEDREVPFDITSNTRAAYQNAMVVFEALNVQELEPDQPIYVLEIASGIGIFAINFLNQFKSICEEKQSDYYERLHFMLSDYSRKTIEDYLKNKTLCQFRESGKIDFYILDALSPRKASRLDGTFLDIDDQMLSAVIANYTHCVLPVTVMKKKNNTYYNKYIALELEIEDAEKIEDKKSYLEEIINNPTKGKILNDISETVSYHEANLTNDIRDPVLRESIVEVLSGLQTASLPIPLGSCQHIDKIQGCLKQNGILLISDKGVNQVKDLEGEYDWSPSIHGNCFAHTVVFPILEKYAKKKGMDSLYSKDSLALLDTILLVNNVEIPESLEKNYKYHFIDFNFNIDSHDFFRVAEEYSSEEKHTEALRFHLKALQHRTTESASYYYVATSLFEMGRFQEALIYCEKGKQYDYMSSYDFGFLEGRIYYRTKSYDKALSRLKSSLKKFGKCKEAFYNMGLCYFELGDYRQAYTQFLKVSNVEPKCEQTQDSILKIKEAVFNQWLEV